MIKRSTITIFLVLALLVTSTSISAYADDNGESTIIQLQPDIATATINGEEVTLDVAPYLSDDNRTLTPLRFIAEALGAEVTWDPVGSSVFYNTPEGETVLLTIGRTVATKNGEEIHLSTPPVLHRESGRSLVPLRFFSETMGFHVQWEADTQTITITDESTEETTDPSTEEEPASEPDSAPDSDQDSEPEPEPDSEPAAEDEEPASESEEPEPAPLPEVSDLADPATLEGLEISGPERISLSGSRAVTREYSVTGYNEEGEEVDLTDVPIEWNFMAVLGFHEEWNPEDVGVTLTQTGQLTLKDVHADIRSATWIYLLVTTPEDYEHGYFEADKVITLL
ncbi:copper amine oxidase N-terminal domain-containing protein [Tindallia californiensis]|uniref:Copper amine oxidase N-terminal domain-containing protein n=1 Tax=Tindallia californiensis TaxID=159292 RepID=A0A1H3PEL6_9FIRM|nr:copper amine oxidase N-terminal domain-containing protein [Tindallia californiensis]SDY99612.1 Copper amine oxidase N-terminal domain-containing protein [Tindallia californiensis]